MEYNFQRSAINNLMRLSNSNHHCIMIEGMRGSGKSFLAKQFQSFCSISNYIEIQSKSDQLRDHIEQLFDIDYPIIVCIDNLDTGSPNAIGTVLKFIEEPRHNIRIIVTCTSRYNLPDTISSRCVIISISNPTANDIMEYAKHKDLDKYTFISKAPIYSTLSSFSDIDSLYAIDSERILYLSNVDLTNGKSKRSISSILWEFTHFSDNSEMSKELIMLRIRYILHMTSDYMKRKACLECLDALDSSKVATHVILYRFLIDFGCLN